MKVTHERGRLQLALEDAAPVNVKAVRPLPLTEPQRISFFNEDKEEIAALADWRELDEASQAALRQALDERYFMPEITRVTKTETWFGTHYWEVDTNRGATSFALREPGKNVTWTTPEKTCVIRDTVGNRFQIADFTALDPASQRRVLNVL